MLTCTYIQTEYDNKQMLGLCHKFTLKCEVCNWTKNVYTSKNNNSNEGRRRKEYDVNCGAVIAFRELGKGFSAIENLLWLYEHVKNYLW